MEFDAIIFDCDGVLVDSEAIGLEASAEYLRGHGFSWTPADLVRIFTGFRDDVFAAKLIEAYRGIHAADPPPELFEGLIEERRKRRHLLAPVAGAADALVDARARGPMAIASSSRTEILHSKLQRTSLFDLAAPHIYSADLVDHGKPAPDIFLYAADRIGVAPHRCMVLEDSVNGVRAGVAAGMTVWGFTGGGHCFDGHAERLIAAGARCVAESFDHMTALLDGRE